MKKNAIDVKGKVIDSFIYGFEGGVIVNFEDDTYLMFQAVVDYDDYLYIEDVPINWDDTGFVDKDLIDAGIITKQELEDIRQRKLKKKVQAKREIYLRLKAEFEP